LTKGRRLPWRERQLNVYYSASRLPRITASSSPGLSRRSKDKLKRYLDARDKPAHDEAVGQSDRDVL
jgi:hypothetical protein